MKSHSGAVFRVSLRNITASCWRQFQVDRTDAPWPALQLDFRRLQMCESDHFTSCAWLSAMVVKLVIIALLQWDLPQAQGHAKRDCHNNSSSEKDSRERKAERISQDSQRPRRKRTARIAQMGNRGVAERFVYRTGKSIETKDT